MPRYFFHLRGPHQEVLDPDGDDLRDLAEAWSIAHGLAHHLAGSQVTEADDTTGTCFVEVADDMDEVVLRVPIGPRRSEEHLSEAA